ncbi:flippase-like domain-containing protein [bacterium]|nr:flippase-like domain-containing protein [bacterium]
MNYTNTSDDTANGTVQKRSLLNIVLGIFFSSFFLYLSLRKLNWHSFVTSLQQTNPLFLILGSLCIIGAYFLFAVRWRVLLGRSSGLSVNDAYDFIMITNCANLILPSRLGDLARALMTGRYVKISVSYVLGSIILERIFDTLTLLIFALSLSFVINFPALIQTGVVVLTTGLSVAVVVVVFLNYNEVFFTHSVRRLLSFFPLSISQFILNQLQFFTKGLKIISSIRQFMAVLLLGLLAWAVFGIGTLCNVIAFRFQVPWYAGFFVLLTTSLGSLIPSSPGSIGIYHYLAILSLSVWLPDKSMAMGYAVVTHAMFIITFLIAGIWSLGRKKLSFQSITQLRSIPREMVLKEDNTNVHE